MMLDASSVESINEAEFKVFSQWGEDGIIQYLVARVDVQEEFFIEFGVGNYQESNTRFLLQHNNWCGLIIDGGTSHLKFVGANSLSWMYSLDAVSEFITAENIDGLLIKMGVPSEPGLLSIDIDGNDYWVLLALDAVRPSILIVEYNALFGSERAVTIPYDPLFDRRRAHHSLLYFGASLAAIVRLASQKGYAFVGTCKNGNNAFFVRSDLAAGLPCPTVKAGYHASRFRESHDEAGRRSFVTRLSDRQSVIGDLPILDVISDEIIKVSDIAVEGDGGS
jgi:hypothetical protein